MHYYVVILSSCSWGGPLPGSEETDISGLHKRAGGRARPPLLLVLLSQGVHAVGCAVDSALEAVEGGAE